MTAEKGAKSRKRTFVGVLALAVAVASSAILWHRVGRVPAYLRGERDRVSPVLKPSRLEDRSFFLVGGRYLLRLGAGNQVLRWKLDRAAEGDLELSFYATAKAPSVPALLFSVSTKGGDGRTRELLSAAVTPSPGTTISRKLKTAVGLPAGAEIEFCLSPDVSPETKNLDAGITVPRITTRGSGTKPGNVLIVSIDALRRDALGVYQELAGRRPAMSMSPELDRFSENAVIFMNARTTQSSTWPALSSMHLSAYPFAHGVTANRNFLEAPGESIATMLRDRGYATLALGSNAISLNIPGFEEKRHYFKDDARMLEIGRAKVAEHAAAPFFHWYHLFGCHDNYFPPEWVMKIVARDDPGYVHKRISTNDIMRGKAPGGPDRVAAVRRLYEGALFYVDSLLKETFDDLKRRGLWDDTLIIVTADHGEELYDHHGYFHHSPSLYEGALRVPLLIKFPRQHGRRVVRENVSHVDILPTLHHFFVGRPEPGRFAGLSLVDLMTGKSRPFRERVLFAEAENSQVAAAILGKFKVIHNPSGIIPRTPLGQPFPMGPVEFYDLEKDPGETKNLAGTDHPVLRRLLAETSRYIREARAPGRKEKKNGSIELSNEERREAYEALRTLGYIQ